MHHKILIIGGNGYIGTALLDFLKSHFAGSSFTCLDCDEYKGNIMQYNDVKYIHAKYQDMPIEFYTEFEDIILLAGQGSVSNSENLLTVIDNNVRNFAWLINIIKPEQKFIYASSSSVYGSTANDEASEDFNKISGYAPYNYYDWSKQSIDQLAQISGKHYYGLRFGTVNGFSRNLRNDVMVNSMCYNAKNDNNIYLHQKNVNRPVLGINDLCKAVCAIISYGQPELSGIYNLNSFNTTVHDAGKTISSLCNVPCKIINEKSNAINFKLVAKSYDFKINSEKFMKAFNFEFQDTIFSITSSLVTGWDKIENMQNRLSDKHDTYKIISNCRVCSTATQSLLDLGHQPLANCYVESNICKEDKFPLHLQLCPNCYHTQLNCVVKPETLFKNYLYVSGTSKTLNDFFDTFAQKAFQYCNIEDSNNQIKILEIACNDGSQLDAFVRLNHEIITVGVDPAENIYRDISSKKRHDIYCEFFSQETVNKLKSKYQTFDIIVAQNVFAHIDYPSDFLKYVKQLMNDKTRLYIQTSQKRMISENQFDTVYHEHLSFFNTNSMKLLCEYNGLILDNVDEHPIHGCSYIFGISKQMSEFSNTHLVLQEENDKGLYNINTYHEYKLKCLEYKNKFHNKIIQYKLDKKSIIAFGSTAKSMTLFNSCNLDSLYIDYMIDDNPLKHNLYTPGSKILVCPTDILRDINADTVIIITAWNFYQEIKQKILNKLTEYNIHHSIYLLDINSLHEEVLQK